MQRLLGAVHHLRVDLDAVEPRLLHGDLWHLKILLDADDEDPIIVGVLDRDNVSWGDPWADWTIHCVRLRTGTEVDDFWETYGSAPITAAHQRRALLYRATHLAGARLDIHRRGLDLSEVPSKHWDLSDVLDALGA